MRTRQLVIRPCALSIASVGDSRLLTKYHILLLPLPALHITFQLYSCHSALCLICDKSFCFSIGFDHLWFWCSLMFKLLMEMLQWGDGERCALSCCTWCYNSMCCSWICLSCHISLTSHPHSIILRPPDLTCPRARNNSIENCVIKKPSAPNIQ
jgi:hypothetical protein